MMIRTVALRLLGFGMVCLDAGSLKRASAIVQAFLRKRGKTVTADDERYYAQRMNFLLRKWDKLWGPWPFQYIRHYPCSPFELPVHILGHACGIGARLVPPPGEFDGSSFNLLVCNTPYKKQRLNQTPAEGEGVPAQAMSAAHSPHSCEQESSSVGPRSNIA